MRQNVNPRDPSTKNSEKKKSCGDRTPRPTLGSRNLAPPNHTKATEHTDGAKNGRRCSHRYVGRALEKSVREIAGGAGEEHQSKTEPHTQHAKQGTEKNGRGHRVTYGMGE